MAKLKNMRHELFCQYYVTELNGKLYNGTESVIKAGYSEKTAHVQASRLLKNVKVRARINELKQEVIENLQLDKLYALNKYKKIVEDDITNYLNFDTKTFEVTNEQGEKEERTYIDLTVKDSNQIDTWNIQEVSKGKDGQFRLKLHSKEKALEKISEYLKLFEEKDKDKSPPVIVVNTLPGGDKIGN